MKQAYIGPQHTYERIEGDLRKEFISGLYGEESREDIGRVVSEFAGGDHDENRAYAEGFVRAYFREHSSGYKANDPATHGAVSQSIPGVEDLHAGLDKHIQNGWVNGRNTRIAAWEQA